VGDPPDWGCGGGLTTLLHKTQYLLQNATHSLGTGRIIWHNASTGKFTYMIRVAHDRNRLRAVVSAVMNLRVLLPRS
jgi:hypothetical protein